MPQVTTILTSCLCTDATTQFGIGCVTNSIWGSDSTAGYPKDPYGFSGSQQSTTPGVSAVYRTGTSVGSPVHCLYLSWKQLDGNFHLVLLGSDVASTPAATYIRIDTDRLGGSYKAASGSDWRSTFDAALSEELVQTGFDYIWFPLWTRVGAFVSNTGVLLGPNTTGSFAPYYPPGKAWIVKVYVLGVLTNSFIGTLDQCLINIFNQSTCS